MNQNIVSIPNQVKDGSWLTLSAWGIRPAGEENSLTRKVILPEGWQLREVGLQSATNVPMGEVVTRELYDDKGRKRANVSISTAVRDNAFISLCRRFTIAPQPELSENQVGFCVLDAGAVIFATDVAYSHSGFLNDNVRETVRNVAKVWLLTHYPDYQNTGAYWD
ncbi:MAG: hypothetical protein K2Y32_16205 [Candidatus Obscuribacterales bacterium]|jgi:hypothetical protein|nr:hypothetical protein [Candidatus Obscuribacterales bacterium]